MSDWEQKGEPIHEDKLPSASMSSRPSPKDELTWVGHLGELRKRLLRTFMVFILFTLMALFFSRTIFDLLKPEGLTWHAFSPTDTLAIYFKLSLGIAFFLTIPYLLYELWAFVRPGLTEEEARVTLQYLPWVFFFFISGLLFAYFVVFPGFLFWMQKLNEALGLTLILGVNAYFSLLFEVVFPVALLFELPVVMLFLARLGLLTPQRIKMWRPYAYFLLAVVSFFFVPGDWVTFLLVIFPLIALYELSYVMIRWAYRRWQKAQFQESHKS